MKKIIVTGAGGFIGYALTKKFSEKGATVYAVARSTSKSLEKLYELSNVNVILCDLDKYHCLPEMIADKIDIFYHLAWQGVSDTDSTNADVQLQNIRYSCDAVQAAAKMNTGKFVFASSIMEYEVLKLMETQLNPDKRNLYRSAKLTAHHYTKIYANDLGIPYNAANISNVYGVGETSNRFINSTLRKMLKGERVKFTAATQMYDFIYIDDAVDMLTLIGEKGLPNKNYYIGNSHPRVLKDFIYELKDCVNPSLDLGIGENPSYLGVSLNYDEFDTNACYDDFGYKPIHTFREGINKTINWLIKTEKKHENSQCSNSHL